MNLAELLQRPEGKTLEFKRDLSSPDGVLRTVVAFANTSGGTLVVGVQDKSHRVTGVSDPLVEQERLANLVGDHVVPRLVPDIEAVPWRRTHVLVVHVHPSPSRPHYLKRDGLYAGTYVRVGPSNRGADRDLIAELQRFARGDSYDEQPLPDLNSEAVDFRVASESFAGVRKLKRPDLETLRILTRHQGRLVPTVGGMLLFGHDRMRHFPDAWIQAGRFGGRDKSRITDRAEIRSIPVRAVEDAISFVQKHSLRAARIGAVRRIDDWDLPPTAIREAVINAVVHADYSLRGAPTRVSIFDDRIEIENAGLLPFGLTLDDVRSGVSKLRNRVIGRTFHELGLIEQWGSGIQRMSAACREAGMAEPLLEELSVRFRVTIFTERTSRAMVDARDEAILATMTGPAGRSTGEIAAVIGMSTRATRTRLGRLVERGLVREVGSGKQDPRRRYYRAR